MLVQIRWGTREPRPGLGYPTASGRWSAAGGWRRRYAVAQPCVAMARMLALISATTWDAATPTGRSQIRRGLRAASRSPGRRPASPGDRWTRAVWGPGHARRSRGHRRTHLPWTAARI